MFNKEELAEERVTRLWMATFFLLKLIRLFRRPRDPDEIALAWRLLGDWSPPIGKNWETQQGPNS